MVNGNDIAMRSERMREAIGAAYGFKAKDLKSALRRVGRRMPNTVRMRIAPVLEAETFGGNPKLLRRVDTQACDAAERALKDHLKSVDISAERRTAILRWCASAAFYILIVFGSLGMWIALTGQAVF